MQRSYKEIDAEDKVTSLRSTGETVPGSGKIKVRIRFDYRGLPRPPRFIFGGKGSREVAENLRQKHASLWRNIPLQGVHVDDIEHLELYSVYEESEETRITYAPIELKLTVDSLEECIPFICREEFRRIEFLEPFRIELNSFTLERLFYRFGVNFRRHTGGSAG